MIHPSEQLKQVRGRCHWKEYTYLVLSPEVYVSHLLKVALVAISLIVMSTLLPVYLLTTVRRGVDSN